MSATVDIAIGIKARGLAGELAVTGTTPSSIYEISQEAFVAMSKHLKVSVQEQREYHNDITGSNKED